VQHWFNLADEALGMKMHIGVDSQTGLTHSAVVTAKVTPSRGGCPPSHWNRARHRVQRCPRSPGMPPAIGWNSARHQRGIVSASGEIRSDAD